MAPQKTVTVSIVGTGSTKGGGDAPTTSGTIAQTPGDETDLLINVVPPVIAITVRFVTLFLTTFVGLLTAAGVGGSEIFAPTDLAGLVQNCAWASLTVAVLGLLKNVITVFGRLEGKYPLSTGSI